MTGEFEVIISKNENRLLDSNQARASVFSVVEVGGSRLLRNSGDYLPDCTVLWHRGTEFKMSTPCTNHKSVLLNILDFNNTDKVCGT
jgi:hypothetical protein